MMEVQFQAQSGGLLHMQSLLEQTMLPPGIHLG